MKKPRVSQQKFRQHIVLREDQKRQLEAISQSHDRGISAIVRDLLDVALPSAMKNADEMLRQRFQQDDLAIQIREARQLGDEKRLSYLLEQV